jgi:hypothetical protein
MLPEGTIAVSAVLPLPKLGKVVLYAAMSHTSLRKSKKN